MVKNHNIKKLIAMGATLVLGALGVTGAVILVNHNDGTTEIKVDVTIPKAEIEYSQNPEPATITLGDEPIDGVETGQGSIGDEVRIDAINGYGVPTVEAVGADGPVTEVNNSECPEGEECGRGAYVPTLDISSPQAFANQVLGQCIDVDGYYGSQCWDEMAAYFINYIGHTLYTCGTGAAKGTIADGCWQQNAGSEFTMIWDPTQIQAGDIAVYSTGQWGHIGMAMGDYNNGYFTLLGQNQGGPACPGGGAAGNIINLSTRDFIGAFRPNIYIKPEPEPEPEPEPVVDVCKVREVVKGDTLGKIMKECRGETKWGAEMNDYAQHWYSTKFQSYLTVYDGWASINGVGLFAGDVIEYKEDNK